MLMSSCFSMLFVIEAFVLRAVVNNTSCSLYDIVTQIAVTGVTHFFVFGFKFTRLVIFPDDATVLGICITVFESLDRSYLGKD